MKLVVIEIDDSHLAFVRQQHRLHGPDTALDFGHFPALIPGKVVGTLHEVNAPTPGQRYRIENLEA